MSRNRRHGFTVAAVVLVVASSVVAGRSDSTEVV